jgi:hypothetical protein
VSLDPEVATVNKSGRVTAVGVGEAKITATAQGESDVVTVTVQQVIVAVEVSPSYAFLEIPETQQLSAVGWDANDNPVPTASFTWSSTKPGVARVDSNGMVTAVTAGEAEITATANGGAKASSAIAVGERGVPPSDPPPGEWNRVLADTSIVGDVVVPDGEAWLIGANVRVRGNVRTVNGIIALRSGSSLTFVGGDPAKYVGGGMHFIPGTHDNDYGIWVGGMGASGKLDISCTPKTGWNRTGTDSRWGRDDEYWIAPTVVEDYLPKRWSPGQSIPRIDPRVPAAEVANVTRDCEIVGAPTGHIHIHSTSPSRIEYVRLEGLGVTLLDGDKRFTSGRYAIHLHHMGSASRGMVIRGVAAVGSRGRVYVPHVSHGVTFEDNVSVNSWNSAFWWDPGDRSDDIAVDRLLVLGIRMPESVATAESEQIGRGAVLDGGAGVSIRNSAAAGVRGRPSSDGFFWPVRATRPAGWVFEDNVAHNNEGAGVRFYLRTSHEHEMHRTTTYRNGVNGIRTGQYFNVSHWTGATLIDDVFMLGTRSGKRDGDGQGIQIRNLYVRNSLGPAMRFNFWAQNDGYPTMRPEIYGCELQSAPGYPKVRLAAAGEAQFVTPRALFKDCNITPEDIGIPEDPHPNLPGAVFELHHKDGRRWEVRIVQDVDGTIRKDVRTLP